jgi:hypothetical protein
MRNSKVLRCDCGKRLALVGARGDGKFNLVAMDWSRLRWGEPVLADDWLEIVCPRHRRPAWRGRKFQLEQAWRAAIAAGAKFVTLPGH